MRLPQRHVVANSFYLNAIPFSVARESPLVEYVEKHPWQCSQMLMNGMADAALIPTSELLRACECECLPFGIVAKAPVKSVVLLSQEPINELRCIFLDDSSRTSSVLIRVLLLQSSPEQYSKTRFITSSATQIPGEIGADRGGVIIGDFALKVRDRFNYCYDLAEMWIAQTGLPFTFAIWGIRSHLLNSRLSLELKKRFLHGIQSRLDIASKVASDLGEDPISVQTYIKENISFEIEPDAVEGIKVFLKTAKEFGLIQGGWRPSSISLASGL